MVYMLQVEERVRITDAMAGLKVGQAVTFPWSSVNELSSYRRAKARQRMGDKDAQWSGRHTNHGIRVTRIR